MIIPVMSEKRYHQENVHGARIPLTHHANPKSKSKRKTPILEECMDNQDRLQYISRVRTSTTVKESSPRQSRLDFRPLRLSDPCNLLSACIIGNSNLVERILFTPFELLLYPLDSLLFSQTRHLFLQLRHSSRFKCRIRSLVSTFRMLVNLSVISRRRQGQSVERIVDTRSVEGGCLFGAGGVGERVVKV